MTAAFDHHRINHTIVALAREMTQQGGRRHVDADTLFTGGPPPSDADRSGLADFGLRKNYAIIHASFENHGHNALPTAFDAVVTDGETFSVVLHNGRLWKRDRRSAAVLLFDETRTVVRVSRKGRMIVREMSGPYHDHGHDLATSDLRARASRRPGTVAVVTSIGSLPAILDLETLQSALAVAA